MNILIGILLINSFLGCLIAAYSHVYEGRPGWGTFAFALGITYLVAAIWILQR